MASKFQKINGFVLDEFLDTFGREFCKHEVLWKPQPNCKEFRIQSAVAYRTLARALNLSLELVLELLEAFPAACLDRMSRNELHRIVGVDCCLPDWLTLLAEHFRLVNKSMKYSSHGASPRHELVRALCESAWVGLGAGLAGDSTGGSAWGSAGGSVGVTAAGTTDEASRLQGPRAVAYFAARHGVSQEEVLPAWRSTLQLCVLKLRGLVLCGDRARLLPAALRPSAAERALADLALLHDRSLSQISILTPAKLRMLGLLFQLVVAARREYDEGREREGGAGRADAADDLPPPAGAGRGERGEVRSDESAPTPKESSDEVPHPEFDPELVTLVLSSDTSDEEISNNYSGECSTNIIEVPVLSNKSRVAESGSDVMEKTNASNREGESYISSKSDTRSEYPTKYWYEESESSLSEKQKTVWALVYTDFLKRGRSASLISLQHRWVELLHLTRTAFLTAWNSTSQDDKHVHPLLLVVAHCFPKIVTDKLPSWETLVSQRQIVLESDIKDMITKYQQNDKVLLNITENLCYPDLLQKYVTDDNLNEPHGPSESNNTNTHHEPTSMINNIDKGLQQEIQDNSINNELNVNNNVITMLDQIDPCHAKVSIIIHEDEDDEDKDDNTTNTRATEPDINNISMSNNERGESVREENNHIPYLENCNKINKDIQIANEGVRSQDEASLSEPCTAVIDEKLVNLSRVVITPIEHLPEWNKHSRNGVINCRKFSVRNLMKPVMVTTKQISKCTPYINSNDNYSHETETENYRNEVRIKFEDSFESDIDFCDDINNGINYKKYVELYTMPNHLRTNRIKLTRKLKLSRTYYSLNFWCLDSNIELLKLCKPMAIKLNRALPRVAKRVELTDINEVRRINRTILTAQVSPTVDTPHTQRSCASQEAVNFTNNSISLDSGTTRKTNNSVSSAIDSPELLNLLTNYAIKTRLPKKSVTEPVTKDVTVNTNLMDSIIDAIRLADNSKIQKTLQQSPIPSSDPSNSCNTNIPSTNTFHTVPTSTEEVRNDLNFNSINNSLLDAATASKSHISNHTKDLYVIDPQKMNNINNTWFKPKKAKPNIGDLKEMILLMVKHFDSTMKYDNMKINRSRLNLLLKNFEKEQRDLIKDISKLNKTIPQYVFNTKPKKNVSKNATEANKRKKIKLKQSKELTTLPSGHTENITDVATNTDSPLVDDDCEHNLVIDERRLELSDNMNFKNVQETCNIRKNDKKEKNIKKARKGFKQPNKISEKEKPMLNEYQEWYRQKTMALKYFVLPTSDSSKLLSKRSTTSTEQQSNSCQTNITIQGKLTEKFATTSTEWQNNGCQTNIIKTINIKDLATSLTEKQSNVCQTNIIVNSKNTEGLAGTATVQQSAGGQTNITVKRKNTEDLARIATVQQSTDCQTNITVNSKNTEDLARTATVQQSTSGQTNITVNSKNTERLAGTATVQQSTGCQTNITLKRKNTADLTGTATVQQSTGCQTNITVKRKNTEDLAGIATVQQSTGGQTNITVNSRNTEDLTRTATVQQSTGGQTNITVKRKNTEDLTGTATVQQSTGGQTNITVNSKNTEDLARTATVQQSTGGQTNITVKRKNIEDTASDMTKRTKFSNENNFIYISDSSSDGEVQIIECFNDKQTNKNNPTTAKPGIHNTDKIENGNKFIFFNNTPEKQVARPNVCVINTPVAINTQPVYLIINDSQTPAAPDAIYKTQDLDTISNPIFFQVLANGISFPTPTQEVQQNRTQQTQIVVTNEKCDLTNKCKCIKCLNTLRDDIISSTPDVIQNVTPLDSGNNEPSASLQTQSDHLIQEAITVKEYLEETNNKPTALIKVDSQKLLFFCSKYIILTDVNIPSDDATYRTTNKLKNKKTFCKVLVPSDTKGSVLLLGPKDKSDYLQCECLMGQRVQCDLCQRINTILPNPTKLIKIGRSYYKNISEKPNKYVRLTDKELATNKPSALEGNPHLILVNKMFFKKLTDSPATYVRILSSPPDAATLRHLVRKEVVLYAFDVTHTQHYFTPLQYTHTDGQVTVQHTDDKLVDVLQWILN